MGAHTGLSIFVYLNFHKFLKEKSTSVTQSLVPRPSASPGNFLEKQNLMPYPTSLNHICIFLTNFLEDWYMGKSFRSFIPEHSNWSDVV